MPKCVLTGQPPDSPARLAVGPLPSGRGNAAYVELGRRGWREIWVIQLDDELTADLGNLLQ